MTFSSAVLSWYSHNKRDLPWRHTDDTYRILVSEVMLQQTQVDRVVPKYLAFLSKFPSAKKLAQAKTGDVVALWSGLGYNRRAVNLQKAAQEIAVNGAPATKEAWEALPGVGPYTARAVSAFALHHDVVPVDTNVRRIFSRVFFSGKGTVEKIDAKVAETLPKGRATDWGNALMDFGSLVCTASAPSCSSCPLNKSCKAFTAGTQDAYLRIAPPQKRFEGSRRQVRGAVLQLLKSAPDHSLSLRKLQTSLGQKNLGKHDLRGIVKELEKEQLVRTKSGCVSL